MNKKEVTPVRATIYRGGTSKGIFLHENDLPQDPKIRDKVILAIFGSPDPRQIDGLGGADVLTSKLAIVGPPSIPDADVDYTFGQVNITSPYISYSGLCGNISSGVAPFAIEEGLVRAVEPLTKVRVYNKNTDQIFITEVPVKDGKVVSSGDYVVPGVPGTGAKLNIDMVGTVGSCGKGLLPTGHLKDTVTVAGLGDIEGSLVDVVNPCFFIRAADVGLRGDEVKNADFSEGKLEQLEAVRKEVFGLLGKPYDAKDAVPFLAFVAESFDYTNHLTNETILAADCDFLSRVLFLGGIHKTYPGSISCCTGAAAVIPGTVVYEVRRSKTGADINIGHPGGVVDVIAESDTSGNQPRITRICYGRTARRLMDGYCYVPNRFFEEDK
jgi:2-methylaconitate cis-trans-isomerase PrpF